MIGSIDHSESGFAPLAEPRASGTDFAGLLSAARAEGAARAPSNAEQAREAAEQLVAIAFVQPVLQGLRESEGAAEPFAPSSGEKQFGSLLDAEIARGVVKASQWPLVDRLARDLLGQQGAAPREIAVV